MYKYNEGKVLKISCVFLVLFLLISKKGLLPHFTRPLAFCSRAQPTIALGNIDEHIPSSILQQHLVSQGNLYENQASLSKHGDLFLNSHDLFGVIQWFHLKTNEMLLSSRDYCYIQRQILCVNLQRLLHT